jgi:short subunit dehydrogenase-like uncharacterized protein
LSDFIEAHGLTLNQTPHWMLYGANGHTGRLIAERAVRQGQKPILAGRSARRIEALAAELDCPSRVFGVHEAAEIVRQMVDVEAVLNCAGPFSATAGPMIDACLTAGLHYLDITGEIAVIEAAAARHDRAVEAGVAVIPAVGFDVVPSDCLAAMLAARLPKANRLILALTGTGSVSPGTAKTMLEGLRLGGRARIDGRIAKVPLAWKSMEIPFREGPRSAVTIPWGDVASAWHSTGIPNVEVYVAMSARRIRWLRRLRPLVAALRLPLPQSLLTAGIRRFLVGRSDHRPQASRGSFWGVVSDADGNSVEATLETPPSYSLTAATAMASLERVLAGGVVRGFATPSRAFGSEFILTFAGTDFRWQTGQ